ncbi:TPA: hypothetical protein N0F65_010216 [Lagenidium giganteum]|uniref:rRNA adenine N(6)-methyltransferase n=1 Tax=Lagenidium giganteum TaxID=4803 RepID=A0AAV2Z175_9STRA|nr:TPA: hypothetical protein N0F65_010216 [Lagenidium giganteum]
MKATRCEHMRRWSSVATLTASRWGAKQPTWATNTAQQVVRMHKAAKNVGSIQNTPHLKRKLGQHLLVTESILSDTVNAANLPRLLAENAAASDSARAGQARVRVLEIGPGTGNLTSALLNAMASVHVHAVEYDPRMVERLHERFADVRDRFTLENLDFEAFEFPKHDHEAHLHFDACVANIPYQLSSLIIARLSSYMFRYPERFRCAVLLVQEEFAQRLLARPGDQNYTRLSVNTALVASVSSVVPVGKHHFLPPPKVDSRVIKLEPLAAQVATDDPLFFQRFDTLLRIVFLRKNKTLRALLVSKTAQEVMELQGPDTLSAAERNEVVKNAVANALDECALTSSRAVKVPVDTFVK